MALGAGARSQDAEVAGAGCAWAFDDTPTDTRAATATWNKRKFVSSGRLMFRGSRRSPDDILTNFLRRCEVQSSIVDYGHTSWSLRSSAPEWRAEAWSGSGRQ